MNDRGDNGTESAQRSKFEWRPEDITILSPGDPDYDEDDNLDEDVEN